MNVIEYAKHKIREEARLRHLEQVRREIAEEKQRVKQGWPDNKGVRYLRRPGSVKREEKLPILLPSFSTIVLDPNAPAYDDKFCAICREELEIDAVWQLPCYHNFHKSCLESWDKYEGTCPVCRKAYRFGKSRKTRRSRKSRKTRKTRK